MPRRYKFPARLRVRRRRDFDRVFSHGLRVADQRLTIWVLPNGLGFARIGLVVGRKHGGAVRRNRIKRVLREAFRLNRALLPAGFDLACAPRAGAELNLVGVAESLVRLTAQAARRWAERSEREKDSARRGRHG